MAPLAVASFHKRPTWLSVVPLHETGSIACRAFLARCALVSREATSAPRTELVPHSGLPARDLCKLCSLGAKKGARICETFPRPSVWHEIGEERSSPTVTVSARRTPTTQSRFQKNPVGVHFICRLFLARCVCRRRGYLMCWSTEQACHAETHARAFEEVWHLSEKINHELRSYDATAHELGMSHRHERGRWRNNRAENSYQLTRRTVFLTRVTLRAKPAPLKSTFFWQTQSTGTSTWWSLLRTFSHFIAPATLTRTLPQYLGTTGPLQPK